MYVTYPSLSNEAIASLKTLGESLDKTLSVSHRRRMGENKQNALSHYQYSRWYNWTAAQRQAYRECFPANQADSALIGWVLRIPEHDGFLDRMTTWVGQKQAGTVIAYHIGPAKANQRILINDKPVDVRHGRGIGFHLMNVHEIKPSDTEQLWACLMVLGDPNRFL